MKTLAQRFTPLINSAQLMLCAIVLGAHGFAMWALLPAFMSGAVFCVFIAREAGVS